ncbi:hypothetical protein VHEMI02610 [[Torrubiella] hemipterigena]|uniref:DUF1445 domain-containing protein n=1 Tax=[Torrubiella] hemipterigena TaxID=1531966 RepID=A0A0A1SWA2_9HYPO|nr:hypothetical protein VHEMI02610 [[Torrubiella] hemipterigena]
MLDLATYTGQEVRLKARSNEICRPTSGVARGYIQANVVVLPSEYADDFRRLCARNPVPCPLLAESYRIGSFNQVKSYVEGVSGHALLASGLDLRQDLPRYNVYKDGVLHKSHTTDITAEWTDNYVAFLIGCSYSFETALADAGLPPPAMVHGRNCAMYRTNIALCPAGRFTGSTFVVSMRSYKRRDIELVRNITSRFGATHGEPVAWGWDGMKNIGIDNVDEPVWGDAPLAMNGEPLGRFQGTAGEDDEVPVFWACGVTPQEAVMRAGLPGTVMSHAPGYMLLLDIKDEAILTPPIIRGFGGFQASADDEDGSGGSAD